MEVPQILDIKGTMEYTKIGRSNVLELLNSGEIKGFKLFGSWRVYLSDVVDYVNRKRAEYLDEPAAVVVETKQPESGFKIKRKAK